MKVKNKIISLCFSAVLVLSLSGCGNEVNKENDTSKPVEQKDEVKVAKLDAVIDANKYLGSNREKIESEWGEPSSTDEFNWDNSNIGKKFPIKTNLYSKEGMDFEFWFNPSNEVVRIGIEKSFDADESKLPKFDSNENILDLVGLKYDDYTVEDINVTKTFYKKSGKEKLPVMVRFTEIDTNRHTVEIMKIMYDESVANCKV